MTILGVALVLASAFLHAIWNFLLKRSGQSGGAFTWLFTVPSVIVLAPVAVWVLAAGHYSISARGALFLAGSAVLHTVYFLVLQRGYRAGDLSVVYPLARGTGPLLAGAIAIVTLRERPSIPAIIGAVCIATGAVILARDRTRPARSITEIRNRSIEYGLALGGFIGIYTVWDKYLVAALAMPPVLVEWVLCVSIAIIVTPAALADRAGLSLSWRLHKGTAIAGALLSSASYILFLTALAIAPVSRAAPLREVSILIGAALGTRFLAEGRTRQRLIAAGAISAGVALLSFG
ncbi:MAG TPA: DMT family transporter [Gemmatimonadaceae bacterium]|nr:DMT family transporter [Gemmatimonadaceae bacterium]